MLYEGSRDGFSASGFHSKCDNKGSTLTIILSSKNYIFGGYATFPWNSKGENNDSYDSKGFLFSINNNCKMNTKNKGNAIYCDKNHGPCFGGDNGNDLWIID